MVGERTKRFAKMNAKQQDKLMETANAHLNAKFKRIKTAHAQVSLTLTLTLSLTQTLSH